MVKTYILAPNWTTAPPPDGPIRPSHIFDDLIEFVPLNRDNVVEIPNERLNPLDTKTGFRTSRSKLISGELGIFTKVIGLVGVGAGAEVYHKKDATDVLSCQKLMTMTFDPTDDYIADSMKLSEVKKSLKASRFKVPVYMITGLKTGRGGSLESSSRKGKGLRMEGGVNLRQLLLSLDGTWPSKLPLPRIRAGKGPVLSGFPSKEDMVSS